MKLEERIRGDVIVLEPAERLTVETEADFTEVVRRLLQAGWKYLVLNLAGVPYIDSAGLGAMAYAYTSAWRRGGGLKLASLTKQHRHLLAITKLLTVFEVYESEDTAVRSFGSDAGQSAGRSGNFPLGTGVETRHNLR
jgi:anti-sigma B factor antagonist